MTTRLDCKPTLVLAAVLGATLIWGSVPFAQAQEKTGQDATNVAVADEALEDIEIRYARAHLQLAKLELERAEAWNRRIPDLFSDRTIDFLRKHVEIDEEQLRQASKGSQAKVQDIYLQTAQAALEVAEADVARKTLSFKKEHDQNAKNELDYALARANLARLNVQRAKNQEGSAYSLSQLQWQVEELRNQILELHIKVEANSRR